MLIIKTRVLLILMDFTQKIPIRQIKSEHAGVKATYTMYERMTH